MVYVHPSFDENFSFGFIAPWQRQLLLQARSFCLDATHNVSKERHGLLYTIVIRHTETGNGCPVAFFYTTEKSAMSLCHRLLFVRGCGLVDSAKVTIDCS